MKEGNEAMSGSAEVDAKIASLGDWRGETLARLRALILGADPGVTEVMKYKKPSNPAGVPFWERDGIICAGEPFKDKVKLTFAKGALLDDPAGLFNNGFGGGKWRAIDVREGEAIDGEALQALVRAAIALNVSKQPRP